jgi:predicted RNA binding protein YcfA (HicA-like mRNA interferase family)
MPKLGPTDWRTFEKFLFAVGCHFVRPKGGHRIYWREGLNRPVVIKAVSDLGPDIILSNLRTLGISRADYLRILETLR